jgi:dienelactone hydrolase
MPAVAVLVLLALHGAELRAIAVAGLPLIVVAATFHRWPRAAQAAGASAVGVVAAGGGLAAHSALAVLAGVLALGLGVSRAWGINRGRGRRRAWAGRIAVTVGAGVALVVVAYPAILSVHYLAKPRQAISESALGLAHERVVFPASDGVRLSGWWAPGRREEAVVVVHGGGGDREGAVAHARMLHRAGYGVLLYDARGRGRSGGHQNAFGWEWDRDVRGAVDFLARRGVRGIGLLGLSTGAEAAITEAADDPRVGAVIADGVQLRSYADATELPAGDRIATAPLIGISEAAIRAVSGERPPAALDGLVRRLASDRPVLMIATIPIERTLQRRYAGGTSAQVWELPHSGHTQGLHDRPDEYARRVTSLLAALR